MCDINVNIDINSLDERKAHLPVEGITNKQMFVWILDLILNVKALPKDPRIAPLLTIITNMSQVLNGEITNDYLGLSYQDIIQVYKFHSEKARELHYLDFSFDLPQPSPTQSLTPPNSPNNSPTNQRMLCMDIKFENK